jgi:hypothetical protein
MDFLNVPKPFFIIDPRNIKSLRTLTLSGYKKLDVKNALEDNIKNNDLEGAC